LLGGCDIVEEMYESGELATQLGVEQPSEPPAQQQPGQAPPLQIDQN
jgi:monothiol glutaredoxin